MLKNIIKKLSVFIFVLCCLVPLTGCPPKNGMFYDMYAAFNDDRTLINDTIYLFVGTDAKTWYGKYDDNKYIDEEQNLRRFNNIEIGMKIDSNEEYVTKYTISQDEIFSSKYEFNFDDIIFDAYTKDGTFRFNISEFNIENSFTIVFSYCFYYGKIINEHIFSGSNNENGKFIIQDAKRSTISINLETNEKHIFYDKWFSLDVLERGGIKQY